MEEEHITPELIEKLKRFGMGIERHTWQEAFDWFEREHDAYSWIYPEIVGSDEWEYAFKIMYIPFDKSNEKRRSAEFIYFDSFKMGFGTYVGAWHEKRDARAACLEMLIQLCGKL